MATPTQHEKRTVEHMVRIYCHAHHRTTTKELCNQCAQLLTYAHARLDHCPHTHHKPTCRRCTTHCYAPPHRQQIRQIMRYSGPRMLWHSPITAIMHLWRELH